MQQHRDQIADGREDVDQTPPPRGQECGRPAEALADEFRRIRAERLDSAPDRFPDALDLIRCALVARFR